jgi:hypothetical protein
MFGGELVGAVDGDGGDGDWSAPLTLCSVWSSSLVASDFVGKGDSGAIDPCSAPELVSSTIVAGGTAEASSLRLGVTGDGFSTTTGVDVTLGGARGRGRAGMTRGRED